MPGREDEQGRKGRAMECGVCECEMCRCYEGDERCRVCRCKWSGARPHGVKREEGCVRVRLAQAGLEGLAGLRAAFAEKESPQVGAMGAAG